jgi:hypothetical protein
MAEFLGTINGRRRGKSFNQIGLGSKFLFSYQPLILGAFVLIGFPFFGAEHWCNRIQRLSSRAHVFSWRKLVRQKRLSRIVHIACASLSQLLSQLILSASASGQSRF